MGYAEQTALRNFSVTRAVRARAARCRHALSDILNATIRVKKDAMSQPQTVLMGPPQNQAAREAAAGV